MYEKQAHPSSANGKCSMLVGATAERNFYSNFRPYRNGVKQGGSWCGRQGGSFERNIFQCDLALDLLSLRQSADTVSQPIKQRVCVSGDLQFRVASRQA